ncbi:amino acid permease/ SLC12A domain-containing protein [Pisolithus marmoratus]|nr:amino acid permease/ SLC12A domain-containing protein [Pisolithus marmoratus]
MSAQSWQRDERSGGASVEKFGDNVNLQPVIADPEYKFDVASIDLVQRRLKQRHVQMIAIAGTLGTGLFLGSGKALSGAGPVGALIAYALVGTVAYSSLCSIGEMTCHAPISGTFPHFAARWVDPALGFAVGWNYYYTNLNYRCYTPYLVLGQVMWAAFHLNSGEAHYFQTDHTAIYTVVISCLVILINIFGVRWFGEAEFGFALIKLSLIIGLILVGLVIDLGGAPNHQRLGFQYWKNPGVVAGAGLEPNHVGLDRFLGILSVLVQATFSFQGMELVAVAASETENPRRNIAKAVRRVFYRICIFYILGIFITGLIVPYNDPELLQSTGNAAQSPYVIAMTRAGIKVLPSIVNAGVLTSAFSASNSFLFCSSRILYGLSLRGQAPYLFAYCTSSGIPIVAIGFTGLFAFLSLMNVSSGSETVFNWLVNLTAVGGFFTWASINFTYLFFYRGLRAQGIDRKQRLHYWSALQPGLAVWGVTWCIIFILINGFEVFWSFKAAGFLTAYINIPFFCGLYAFWKFTKRTKIWKPKEMDFVTGIPTPEETESPEIPPTTFWQKVAAVLF